MQIIVSSDGSTDSTTDVLRAIPGIQTVISDNHQGKCVALNRALELAKGQIVIFTDVRQRIEPGAFRKLLRNFADTSVGAASGELMIPSAESGTADVGLYWRYEKAIRKMESATGSVMGVTGAFYATRRELVGEFPAGLILDDVYSPLKVLQAGKRVVFEPEAIAWDEPTFTKAVEFRRKVRTLMGNYELLRYFPRVLIPVGEVGFRFFSHKLVRLAVPWFLLIALVSSAALSGRPLYLGLFLLQIIFYLVGTISARGRSSFRVVRLAGTFCLLNAAAFVAFFAFLTKSDDVSKTWQTTTGVAQPQTLNGNVKEVRNG
jgi:cellulose synthase/poly-beta-1,6-N-acetylglucosamine synthase-like glycosyltransferase